MQLQLQLQVRLLDLRLRSVPMLCQAILLLCVRLQLLRMLQVPLPAGRLGLQNGLLPRTQEGLLLKTRDVEEAALLRAGEADEVVTI